MRKLLLSLLFLPLTALPETPYFFLGGESASVKNVDNALVANIRSGQTSNQFSRIAGRTPIIWARYNPGKGVGTILVTRTTLRPDGSTDLMLTPFRPSDGMKFANGGVGRTVKYFGGVNPFGNFDLGDDYFHNVNFTAFLAATGLAMRSANASVGFVYHPTLQPDSQQGTAGAEMSFGSNSNVNYRAEGRWLMAMGAESGDRRGFVPAYKVEFCNPILDPRTNCLVKGFASFVPWNDGNLPTDSIAIGTRTSNSISDTGAMASLFSGIENFVREGSLWAESAWGAVSTGGTIAPTLSPQSMTIGQGDVRRRDQLADIVGNVPGAPAANTTLNSTVSFGKFIAGTTNVWDLSDSATAEFIVKPLTTPGGGLGVTAAQANWQNARDKRLAEDVLNRQGTASEARTVFNAQPK